MRLHAIRRLGGQTSLQGSNDLSQEVGVQIGTAMATTIFGGVRFRLGVTQHHDRKVNSSVPEGITHPIQKPNQ